MSEQIWRRLKFLERDPNFPIGFSLIQSPDQLNGANGFQSDKYIQNVNMKTDTLWFVYF